MAKNAKTFALGIVHFLFNLLSFPFQDTPLLDKDITEQIHRLELTGTPSASLPEDLVNFPHSPDALELCFDSNLRVTLQKVWKPLELVLVLYLTNQNQANAPISDVISVLEPPSNLIGSFDSSTSNRLQDDTIAPLDWVRKSSLCMLIYVSCESAFEKNSEHSHPSCFNLFECIHLCIDVDENSL